MNTAINVIITGSTGMVGEGVLIECLRNPQVESVLVINRRSCGYSHPKLKEILHSDFYDIAAIESRLKGYDACFFCLGISSIGVKEPDYYRVTYTLTLTFAQTLSRINPEMTFCYVSGEGTDSSEIGRQMWARVKGKTENDLMKLPFRQIFAFRPGLMKPTPGQKNILKAYKFLGWLYPLLHLLFPGHSCNLSEVGMAMIKAVALENERKVLEVNDIVALTKG
jgi:hypothetical protein